MDFQTTTQWAAFAKLGDINGDGYIDDKDYALLEAAYGSVPGATNWNPAADLNGDGKVDLADLVTFGLHKGENIWSYYGISPPSTTPPPSPPSYATIVIQVQDTNGIPLAGASIQLNATFPPGGTIPWSVTTDSSGIASVTLPSDQFPIVTWVVTATGYAQQSGSGNPPQTIKLQVSSTPTPPPGTPPTTTPPIAPAKNNTVPIVIGVTAAIAVTAAVGVALSRRRR